MPESDSSIVKRSPRTLSEAEWAMIEEYGIRWAIESLNINGSELAEMYFTMANNAYELGDIKEADNFRSKAEMIVVQFSENFDQKPKKQVSRQTTDRIIQKEEIIDVLVKTEAPKNQQSRNNKVMNSNTTDKGKSKIRFGKLAIIGFSTAALLGSIIGIYFFSRSKDVPKDPDLHLFCTNRTNREARYYNSSQGEKENSYKRCMETTKLIIPSDEEVEKQLIPNLKYICWAYRQAYDDKKLDPLDRYSSQYFEMLLRTSKAERECNQLTINQAQKLYREMSNGSVWASEKDKLYIDLGLINWDDIRRRDHGK